MESQLVDQIRRAIRSVGITDQDVRVSSYLPGAFGNFVVVAHTDIGCLRIVYDRGFFVDVEKPPSDPRILVNLVRALQRERATGTSDED